MKVLVLGSGASGGFPQWNCPCRQCVAMRAGELTAQARTQGSVAVSADGGQWVLLNASPDIAQQIRDNPALHPDADGRSPIRAVVLTDSQLHHTGGLISLREEPQINLYATPQVFEDLTVDLPLLTTLDHYCAVRWHPLGVSAEQPGADFTVDPMGDNGELLFRAHAVPGRGPAHVRPRPDGAGQCIAVEVHDPRTGQTFVYSPALGGVGADELAWMREADCLMLDGTFWQDRDGASARGGAGPGSGARALGHLPQQGDAGHHGLVDVLRDLDAPRKILVDVHNTNPILDETSGARRTLAAEGIEVAHDGMVIEL